MDKNIIYAAVAGIIMYILVIYLAYVQRDLTGQQLILMLATPLVIGVISRGVKKGLILGLIISFVMLIVEAIIIQPGAFTNPNIVMAIIVMSLPFVLISAGLGAVGGLIGRRIFKK